MMTSRERFRKTLAFEPGDRVPLLKEGIREEVVEEWRKQGLAENETLDDIFHYDQREEIWLDLEPIPALERWPHNCGELDSLRSRLDIHDRARLPEDWLEIKRRIEHNHAIAILRVHRGFFLSLGVNDWTRFLEVMYLIQDDPTLVRAILEVQGDFSARLVEHVLTEITVDAALFSEPIGGNDRPLLSPDMYEEFVLPSLQPLFSVLEANKVKTRIFRTYANVRQLLPVIVNSGFNCLWACETNIADMDYLDIRQKFGQDLGLIGGLDLDALRKDKHAIETELRGKVPPLLASGGYIPLADGRVRNDVPFRNYVFYRRLLEDLVS